MKVMEVTLGVTSFPGTELTPELRHIRYFIAVAEELNFNRAAVCLHIAQPPLSTQIKDLEKELGVRLFDRTGRGTTLTREGEISLLEARQILDHVDKARRAVNQTAAGELGRLRVTGVPHAFTEMLPSMIPRFRREKPNVSLIFAMARPRKVLTQFSPGPGRCLRAPGRTRGGT